LISILPGNDIGVIEVLTNGKKLISNSATFTAHVNSEATEITVSSDTCETIISKQDFLGFEHIGFNVAFHLDVFLKGNVTISFKA